MARQIHISVIRRRKIIRKQKRPKLETRFPIYIFAHTTPISTQAFLAYNKRATTATNNMPKAAGVATDAGLPIITPPLAEQVDKNTGSPAASLVQPTICTRPLLYAHACDNNTTDRRKAQTPSIFETGKETGKNKATTNRNNKNATQQKMIRKE